MKWWFSSWNLFLFSLSKVCRISSAYCFISGFTASQSPLFCGAKYSGLHFAQYSKFCSAFASKVFSTLYTKKHSWKNLFNLYPTSFFCLLHFVLLSVFLLRVHERQIISLSYMDICKPFCGGIFAKVFYPSLNQGHEISKVRDLKEKFF